MAGYHKRNDGTFGWKESRQERRELVIGGVRWARDALKRGACGISEGGIMQALDDLDYGRRFEFKPTETKKLERLVSDTQAAWKARCLLPSSPPRTRR